MLLLLFLVLHQVFYLTHGSGVTCSELHRLDGPNATVCGPCMASYRASESAREFGTTKCHYATASSDTYGEWFTNKLNLFQATNIQVSPWENEGGLLDVLIAREGRIRLGENVGNVTHPKFVMRAGAEDPFRNVQIGSRPSVAACPIFSNDTIDLIVGNDAGRIVTYVYNNDSTVWELAVSNPFYSLGALALTRTMLGCVDVDDDQDKDVLVGSYDGTVRVFRNDGNGIFQLLTSGHPFSSVDVGTGSTIAVAGFKWGRSPRCDDRGRFPGVCTFHQSRGRNICPG